MLSILSLQVFEFLVGESVFTREADGSLAIERLDSTYLSEDGKRYVSTCRLRPIADLSRTPFANGAGLWWNAAQSGLTV